MKLFRSLLSRTRSMKTPSPSSRKSSFPSLPSFPCLALFGLVAALSGAYAQTQETLFLFPNGDFEIADGDSWDDTQFAGNQTFNWPTTGGNPNGYAEIVSGEAVNWAVLVSNDNNPYPIADIGDGLVAGRTYTFQYDMKNSVAGENKGGIKVESWSATGRISDSGNQRVTVDAADTWATYTYEYTIHADATHLKVVPLWSPGETVGFDNVGVIRVTQDNWKVTASASIGGSISPSGDVTVANGGSQVFSFTAADVDYEFTEILVNGQSVGNSNPYTLANVIADTTIEAKFAYTAGIPNSGFEKIDDSEWVEANNGSGTFSYSYPATGGSGSGHYAVIDHSADDNGEGYLVANNGQIIKLSSLSLSAGNIYNFTVDMKGDTSNEIEYGGLRVEFYNGTDDNSRSSVLRPLDAVSTDWKTFKIPVYLPHDTDGIKIVLVSGEGSVIHYDNVGVEATSLASYERNEIPDAGFDYGPAAYEQGGAPNTLHYFEDSGGNPNAYAVMDHTGGGYGLLVTNNGAIHKLSDLGLSADEIYQFTMDMKLLSGNKIGGMKVDFFNGNDSGGSTGDIFPGIIGDGSTWETYTFVINVPAGVDGLKVVPLWGADSEVGYDNIAFSTVPYVAPPVVHTWNGGGGDSDWGNSANWDTNQVPNLSNTTANATAIIGDGASVQYDPGTNGGDFQLRNGNILQIDAGGSWEQIGSGSWFQAGGGVLRLNGGTFNYGTAGVIAGREEAASTLEVTENGGTIINLNHPTELNWGTVTLDGPLDIQATGNEIGLRGKNWTLADGSDWVANAISFGGSPSFLHISGGTLTINAGAGIAAAEGTDKGINFLAGSTGEVIWADPGVSAATVNDAIHPNNRLTIDGAAAAVSAFSVSTRGSTVVASLANVAKTVTISTSGNGSVTGPGTVAYNGSASYSITPDAGNVIADVLVNGASVGIVTSYNFTDVVQNQSIHAVFIEEGTEFTITASAGTGGSISPSGDTSVEYGNDQSYTITPDTGYYVLDVQVNGSSVGPVTSYDFTNITSDATISASFTDRELLRLDFQGALGATDNVYNTAAGWITLLHDPNGNEQPWVEGDENHPNVGDSGYDFKTLGVGAWSSGWMWKPEFGAGGAKFTLGGLAPGQEVTLYAAAGWAPAVEAKGAYIVFGDSGAAGVKALGGGQSEGNNPLPADLTEIGTATADTNGEVSGAIGNSASFADSAGGTEGQTNGFIFAIKAAATTRYADWILDYSGVGSESGFADDADGDGKSNGLEYVLGTDPSAADAAGLVAGALSTSGGNTFTFTHPQSSTLGSDVTTAYSWSTDLAAFHADGATDNGVTVSFSTQNSAGTVTVTATITGTVPGKIFVRLNVSQ